MLTLLRFIFFYLYYFLLEEIIIISCVIYLFLLFLLLLLQFWVIHSRSLIGNILLSTELLVVFKKNYVVTSVVGV